jgi:hypothetical protein
MPQRTRISDLKDVERARRAMEAIRKDLDRAIYAVKAAEVCFAEVAKELDAGRRVGGAEFMLINRLQYLRDAARGAVRATRGFYDDAMRRTKKA